MIAHRFELGKGFERLAEEKTGETNETASDKVEHGWVGDWRKFFSKGLRIRR